MPFDFKKEFKNFYLPKDKPQLVDVPKMQFIMVDGEGDPNSLAYQDAVQIVYALSYTLKMMGKKNQTPEDFFEYVVAPLEGLWWSDGAFSLQERSNWLWTSMIRQPDFITQENFDWAVCECKKKKPEIEVLKARLESFTEGQCVQMMHFGPYATEPATVEQMHRFMDMNNLMDMTGGIRKHHEIYLSDPRKTAPEKLKTVLRHPIDKREENRE